MKVKLFEGGIMPERAHFDDAGIDLKAPKPIMLLPGDSEVIDFKVGVQIPVGYYGELMSKSGLNVKENIQSMGGVIDSGFRGSIKGRITNNGEKTHIFEKGDKVMQLVIKPCLLCDLDPVDELDPAESGRNENGFGSTGK